MPMKPQKPVIKSTCKHCGWVGIDIQNSDVLYMRDVRSLWKWRVVAPSPKHVRGLSYHSIGALAVVEACSLKVWFAFIKY
jgi:hypothetical protein